MEETLREGPPGREELLDGWMDQWWQKRASRVSFSDKQDSCSSAEPPHTADTHRYPHPHPHPHPHFNQTHSHLWLSVKVCESC